MIDVRGYAARDPSSPLTPFNFQRRETGPHDVRIEILYSGICHSDVHQVRDDWGGSLYPMVPGHEIVGRVVQVGEHVKKFAVGDFAGVGCMVDSCRVCSACEDDQEQYCEHGGPTVTYNGRERNSDQLTFGGYSTEIVVEERFVVKVSPSLDLKAVAPLLCAGITTYSPLRHWKVGPGQKVGVIGLGGLGHMGVKFAKALGARVVMITTSPEKGRTPSAWADEVLLSRDADAMAAAKSSFDFLLNTIPVEHDANPYIDLLKRDSTMAMVGVLNHIAPVSGVALILGRKSLTGSAIGGMAETQEMMDFCAEHGIVSDIELVPMQQVNEAYERLLANDVKYRFVIDIATLRDAA